jgi:uncharacterized protein YcfJ
MRLTRLSLAFCSLVFAAMPAVGQEAELRNNVVVVENVRFDYAQVLNVEPVFQTLRATRTEQHCEPVATRTLAPVHVTGEEEKGRFGRFMDSFKGLFRSEEERRQAEVAAVAIQAENSAMLSADCRIVEVGREFRRPIAYDVDYVYKGTKYRSRLPEDPGRRLKLRVSITPQVTEEAAATVP